MRNSSHSPGGNGQLFPDATLPTRDGSTVALDTFRPKWDLVMVMLGADGVPAETERLLDALAVARTDVESEDGKVLAVSASPTPITVWHWSFPLLLDAGGRVHQRAGAVDAAGRPAPALFTTDHIARSTARCVPERPPGRQAHRRSSNGLCSRTSSARSATCRSRTGDRR